MKFTRGFQQPPLSVFLMALLLIGSLLLLSGCRHAAPLSVGWAQLDVLVALHPDRAMETDLTLRLQEVQAQRARILGQSRPALPPVAMVEQAPSPVALAEPHPSPAFNWQADSFRDALLGARTRMLSHQQAQEVSEFLRRREDQYDKELKEGSDKLDFDYAVRIKQMEAEQAEPMQRAMMSLELAQYNAQDNAQDHMSEHPSSSYSRPKLEAALEAALKEVQHLQDVLKATERAAASELTAAKSQLQEQLTATMQQDISREQDSLKAAYADKNHQLAADIDGHLTTAPDPPQAPPLDYSPLTPTPQSLDLSLLPPQAHASAERIAGERQRAAQEIDETIAGLVMQRQQLHARMAAETRAAVEAVAAQHGYRVRFTVGEGADITAQVRGWLKGYWPGGDR